ncbi:sialin [Drosophila kikkawai]|uniref:Sialin n=1 Tax=Drosophila kikkawai TaxID=30033 RepID=A0A6P4JNU2_DROKI|nr:sialin [Drosophila kikkawai]
MTRSRSWTLPRLSQSSVSTTYSLLGSVRLTYAVCAFIATSLHAAIRNMLGLIILRMVKSRPEDALQQALQAASNVTTSSRCSGSRIGFNSAIHVEDLLQTGDLPWSRNQELAFPGVYYYGYVVSILLSGYLADRCSSKTLLMVSLICQAVAYILLPVMAHYSFEAAVIDLVVCGLLAGCGNPSLYKLFVTWAHPTERTALLSFAYSGMLVGAMVVFPVAGYLSNFGWELSFFVVGSVALLFGIACNWLIYDTLDQHPRISNEEVAYLRQGKSPPEPHAPQVVSVPWKSLLSALPAYAFVLTHVFHCYTFLVLSLLMPRFMSEAMEYDLKEVGFLSAAPYLGGLCSKVVCILGGSYLERRFGPDQSCMRRTLYGICSILTTLFLGIIILADCGNKTLVLLMFILLMASTDMGFSGYWPTLLYFAPSFAGLLSGLANALAHLTGFLAPYLVAALVHTGSKEEWNVVLMTLIAFNTLAMLVFGLCSSTRLQPWDPRNGDTHERSASAKENIS